MNQIFKYPRTQHLEGSALQEGDNDLSQIPFSEVKGKYLVLEEKMDGANSAISFVGDKLMQQSRGHYLTGGPRERHFDLFKAWASVYRQQLFELLGERYIMYGEWLFAKHTIYYNSLPSYFMEFDILDTETGEFLDTETRKQMLSKYDFIHSVKVLKFGEFKTLSDLTCLITPSYFIEGDHINQLSKKTEQSGYKVEQVIKETNPSNLMEGLYIKLEENGRVCGRYKYVRPDFLQTVFESDSHWLDRPIIPNDLMGGTSIF